MSDTFKHLEQREGTWGGAWVFRGTSVPVFMVLDFYAECGEDAALEAYPRIPREALAEAVASDPFMADRRHHCVSLAELRSRPSRGTGFGDA